MTNAPTSRPLTQQRDQRIPARDTVGHFVLHSLIRGSKKPKGTDWRPPSEIADTGRYGPQSVVTNALADLIDAGVVEVVEDHGRSGHRVLAFCDCPPDFYHNDLTDRKLPREACAEHSGEAFTGFKPAPPAPSLRLPASGEWMSLPGVHLESLEGTRLVKSAGKPLDPDSPLGLAKYFDQALIFDAHPSFAKAVDPVNLRRLASAFSKWKKDGVTPVEIRASIDVFAGLPYPGKSPPWMQYLAIRQKMIDAARKRLTNRAMEEHRLDRSYWVGTTQTVDLDEIRRRSLAALSQRDRALREQAVQRYGA